MRVCLYCNGMRQVEMLCPACGQMLIDGGMIEDYYDPYSPYVEKEQSVSESPCIHLLYCEKCGFDTREAAPGTMV